MRPGGRVSAAIEILEDIGARHRPAGEALADWGRAHRFAGSGDRAAIGNLVYDALRHRASLTWRLGSEEPRTLALGVVVAHWGESVESLAALFADDPHAPAALTEDEIKALVADPDQETPGWALADIPEWLESSFEESFGEDYITEGQALALRPPVDLRVNTLKRDREKVLKDLGRFHPSPTPLSPLGVRIAPSEGPGRTPNLTAEAGYQKGWFDVQDEGSQIAGLLAFAQPGEQILDYCAGGGGKTLVLAANMQNKGQIFAYDADQKRLAPIYDRLKRAGTRNVQVRSPGTPDVLKDLEGRMDRVIIDAPCTGTGIWRRRPDTKWRLTPEAIERRLGEQRQILAEACQYVKPGGYFCYITCSVLGEENEQQVHAFLDDNSAFELLSAGEVWEDLFTHSELKPLSSDGCTVTLTPATTGTDGFFFAVMGRAE